MYPPASGRQCTPARFRLVAVLLAVSLLTLTFHLPQRFAAIIPVAHAASANVVISQVYGAGNNSGATYQSDFVELFNRGDSAVSLSGMSIQYASATGTGHFSSNPVATLSGSLAPGQYYLVRLAGGTTNGVALPAADATQTGINLGAGAGKVALVNGTAGLACNGSSGQPCSAADLAKIIDLVGYGSANFSEGSPAAGPSNNTTALQRASGGCADTDSNAADFAIAAPAPRNTAAAFKPCNTATAPSITTQPQSQTVTSGQTATLTVVAGGTSPLTYQWYQGTATDTTAPVGTNSASFTTPALNGTTSYWVRVSNSAGTANSANATVTVTQPTPVPTPTPTPTPVPSGAVVISQVYGGGGNSGATYTHDFVELFNRSAQTVTLSNWSVQYSSATGSSWSGKTEFSATLAPGQYLLIRGATGTAGAGAPLPAADVLGNTNLSGTNGKVALVNNTNTLTGTCPAGGGVMDFVGYGATNCAEGDDETPGDNATPALSNTSAALRLADGCTDTGSNLSDFTVGTPAPRNGGSPARNCDSTPPPTGDAGSTVVISQLYAGGGNSGAAYTHDFVELYNRGTSVVSLGGWSLQYASATGSGWDFTRQPLGGTIAPGEHYLVSLASGGANGASLPQANVVGEINLSATAGKVALVRNFEALEGVCPTSDADVADFVGYGSTASCGEGSKKAASPGTANALHRKGGGAADTNDNQADFTTGAPVARRTAPIVEIGPYVFGSDPRSGSTTAPRDASITVNFTEPVEVSGQWFNIQCSTTGAHSSATVAGGPKSYTLTPNASFVNGEQCTFTIFRNSVRDLDTDDGQPDTDNLPADYAFTFATSNGAPPPYPAGVHLALGNPSGASADAANPNDYLMEKPEYALSYNRDKGAPNWVSWHLSDEWVGSLARFDTFRPDPAVPAEWYRVLGSDYSNSGFDRGHMVPNADRDQQNSMPINQATFLMTNIIPQTPDNNQGPWAAQENYLRTLLPAHEVYIVAGGVGSGGTGSAGFATTIAGGRVHVPSHTWKVALVIPKGDDDLSRVTCGTRAIAVLMPNVQGIRNDNWENYLVSVDHVETLTGYDFFSNLPDDVEHCVEGGVNGVNNPPGTSGGALTTAEDTPAQLTLAAVSPANGTLDYTIVGAPAHGTLKGTGADRVYTPAPEFSGTDSFTFRASDGARLSNLSTVTILVTEANDAPLAAADAKGTREDSALTFPAGDLTANDDAGAANEAGQPLTVTTVSAGPDTHGTVTLAAGQVSYTPASDYNGPASFTYTVCDEGTTGGSPDPKCASASVSVNVASVNDAPALSNVPVSATAAELAVYTFKAQAVDVDGDALTFSLLNAPAGAAIDPATGEFNWTPTEAQGGTGLAYAFAVRVSDGTLSVDSPVSVTVTEVNQAPTLAPVGNRTVFLGGTLTFTARAADADLPAQTLAYSLTGAFPAGASIDPATGLFNWTPTAAQTGRTYTFGVRVTDSGAGRLHAEEVITVGAAYTWSGYLQPINQDGSSVFKLGQTVPVKFQLTGASAGLTGAVARLFVAKVTDSVAGTEEKAGSTANATEGNLFRYADGQYVFNLSTDRLTTGTYQLRVDTGDGVVRVVNVSLR